ncbi:MAG: tetratricopeptide repeat protein [Nannocystaceae bacterium]|nr:tetratricopeptide repeat protein [Nannocystaceae bacterium]
MPRPGRNREAERELLEAIRIWTAQQGEQNRVVAFGYNNLGLALEAQGRLDEAAAAFQRSLAIVERVLGPRHPVLPRIVANVARLALATGHPQQAVDGFRRALALHTELVATQDLTAARLRARLAQALVANGARDEARDFIAQARTLLQRDPGASDDDLALVAGVEASLQ